MKKKYTFIVLLFLGLSMGSSAHADFPDHIKKGKHFVIQFDDHLSQSQAADILTAAEGYYSSIAQRIGIANSTTSASRIGSESHCGFLFRRRSHITPSWSRSFAEIDFVTPTKESDHV